MKGDISASAGIIYTLIGMAILIVFIVAVSPKPQAENTYLSQPGGISMKIIFGKDFTDLIRSPEKGDLAGLGSKSVIKSWDGGEFTRDLMPTAVIYPLVISGAKACPQESGEPVPFGKATLEMDIDVAKLDSYLMENYQEGFGSEEIISSSPETLKNIWVKICWDNGKSCYGCDEGDSDCFAGEGKRLDEMEELGLCVKTSSSPQALENDATLPGPLKCTFILNNLVEKCCPSSLDIQANITAEVKTELGEGLSKKRTLMPTSLNPTLIYYVDYASNPDALFSGIDSSLGLCFKTDEVEKKNPIEGISIYPCRAVIGSEKALYALSDKITGPKEEYINFGDCVGSPATEVNGYKLISPEFGWMCKKGSGDSYYLLNPYAFCRLEGTNLPSFPQVGYLQNRFLSGSSNFLFVTTSTELAWENAKAEIDGVYGLSISTATNQNPPASDNQNANPPAKDDSTQNPIAKNPSENKPVEPSPDKWLISKCSDKCKKEWCSLAIEDSRIYNSEDIIGSDNPEESNYICKNKWILLENSGSICHAEGKECIITLKSISKGLHIDCPCSGQS